jgi:predicted ester cyclase
VITADAEPPAFDTSVLERAYRAYLDALNERSLADLDQFVHDEVIHNDRLMSRQQYADMIADDVRAIPDLKYTIDQLVSSNDTIAARLWFDCTPAREFAGIPPAGCRVQFAEHVFYRFRDRRIEQVWSLIDTNAIRDQLT